jgi:hypothetical protein
MLGPHRPYSNIRRIPLVDGSDLIVETAATADPQPNEADSATTAKKKFVTPEISVPVDVLEATTYFQVAASAVAPAGP